ncbi:MAG: hypothetical protein OXC82_04880 [Rhodobacteraceae bacterium]|nr:hypothetical protein [Paracoccaceae bacterium]MCY4249755.1 hypothetical protein [Paracoccaceae bacterium]
MLLEISSKSYVIKVNPEEGGRIETLVYSTKGKTIDLLKPKPANNHDQDRIPLYGSFVMVPFSNRLSQPNIVTSEGPLAVSKNWTPESCAIHGLGVTGTWTPQEVRKGFCSLSTPLKTAEERNVGIGFQEFQVSEENGLVSRVGYCNNHFDWILAGLGFHPWFNLSGGEGKVEFFAGGKFETDQRYMPTSYNELENKQVLLSSRHNNEIDSCFGNWEGSAKLSLERIDAEVIISSSANNLHVYINKDLDAICAEPVSHVTNAMHDQRWNRFAGMQKVKTGETIWLDMSIKIQGM